MSKPAELETAVEQKLLFPERIICHDANFHARQFPEATWEKREATGSYGANLRHCSYCGSLHPEDLLAVLQAGAHLHGADWKYGWPHKFYVEGIINPKAGEVVEMGGRYWFDPDTKERKFEPFMSPAPATLTLKFYNEHLLDLADTPAFLHVTAAIFSQTRVLFFIQDGKLYFRTAR